MEENTKNKYSNSGQLYTPFSWAFNISKANKTILILKF